MVFVESALFTKLVNDLLDEEAYRALQEHLARHPDAGDVMPGAGGLRKLRWTRPGMGKRGGTRVIYYHLNAAAQIRMVLIYAKAAQENLTPAQTKALLAVMENW